MNGIDLLADTNALIYLLNGNTCMRPFLQNKLAFSIVSEMELLSFSGITESEENNIKSLLLDCNEINISDEIKEKTIEIRKKYKTKLPDAIVAASAYATSPTGLDNNLALPQNSQHSTAQHSTAQHSTSFTL